ncbi:hypothetical protein LCGC14_0531230 [marine sediment metagenome]|uniref:Uncharacterized protein n=1 Tax=marine sediment metagenome TaxID=412755 RepID=A0A0F9SDV5_9ZZZZ
MLLDTNPNQDYDPDPEWLGFDWTFRDSNEVRLLHKIERFEKLHPNLTAMWADQFNIERFVLGPEGIIRYSYKVYGINIQYQPTHDLYQWLTNFDEMTDYRKQKKRCFGCKYRGKGLMCNLNKGWLGCNTPRGI